MELLDAISKKFEVIRENLKPIQQRLVESRLSAPTEELKQTASNLSAQLAAAIDESAAAIRESVQVLDAEIAALNQVAEQADDAVAEMSKKREAALAERKTRRKPKSKAPAPFVADPELYDRLRQELLVYVEIENPAPTAKTTEQGLAFHDWANESALASRIAHAESSLDVRPSDDTVSGPSTPSAQRPISSFESWLHESVRVSRVGPAASDSKEVNWMKLFSAKESHPANGASEG